MPCRYARGPFQRLFEATRCPRLRLLECLRPDRALCQWRALLFHVLARLPEHQDGSSGVIGEDKLDNIINLEYVAANQCEKLGGSRVVWFIHLIAVSFIEQHSMGILPR